MKNKKMIIIVAAALVVVVAVVLIFVKPFGGKSSDNQEELTKSLEKLGKSFYEDYYYPSQEKSQTDVKEFVKRFEKNGIKINLTNLSKISSIDTSVLETMTNSKTKEKCNYENTSITIIPKSPYGKSDYDIKVNLDCGFDAKEAKK